MNNTLSVTKALPEDAAVITQLINSAYEGDPGSPGWTSEGHIMDGQRTAEPDILRLLGQPDTDNFKCYGADGEIIGFVSLQKHEGYIYLGLLSVSPRAQAGGIGRYLLEYAESYARANLVPSIHITVINVRHELVAWYERRGYRATGNIQFFPHGHNSPKVELHLIEMEKAISKQ